MRRRLPVLPLLLLVMACGPATPPQRTAPPPAAAPATPAEPGASTAQDAADLEARLAGLAESLERERERQHVPGMAVAVVRGDRIVFARGFGVRDLASNEAVTPETLFAIGSSTKAFTATAIGMLVDEGKMAWDDPLSRHVPSLQLRVKAQAGEQATVRDALSHRTGFPRMSVLWASGTLSRDEVFQHASRAEPTAALRETFQYNNVMYAGAGEASAHAAGTSWEELVRTRILAPLGMQHTYMSSREASQTGLLATGYTWHPDRKHHKRENLRDIASVAPAGSIHSSALDMAAWLRFQIGDGVFAGKRLIQEATLSETRKQQIEVGGAGGYGLGWFVREWKGQAFIEHGGNIDGFSASVGFLPGADVGYVLLSNTSASLLQSQVASLVFEALLGSPDRGDKPAGEDLTPYVGAYVANFGPFQDARFQVVEKSGALAVDVPGQDVFELAPPDAKGRRPFKATDEVAISFERDDSGLVIAMYVHQAGFDWELPREGVEPTLHVDPAAVAPHLGRYRDDKTNIEVEVLVHRGRLAVDVPGQTKYALDPPAAAGDDKWPLRVRREFYVTFQKDAGGKIQGLTFHQGGTTVAYQRLPDQAKNAPVSMGAIVALRRPDLRARALAAMGHAVMEGKVRFPNAGIEGTFRVHLEGPGRYRQEADLGKAGRIIQVVSGDSAWIDSSFDEPEQLDGLQLAQARIQHPLAFAADWRQLFDKVELLGSERAEGKTVHVVGLHAGELPPWRVYVDATTGDVTRASGSDVQPFGNLPSSISFADHRDVRGVKGLRVPFQITTEMFQSGNMVVTIDRVRTRLRPDASLYPRELPARRGAPAEAPR